MWLTMFLLLARGAGAVFILSGVSKLMSRHSFFVTLRAMPFLSSWRARVIVKVLPWTELTIGSALVMGLLSAYAAWAALALLLAFSLIAVVAVARGLDVPCACFGATSRARLSLRTVVKNALLALFLLPVLIVNRPSLMSADAMVVGTESRSLADAVVIASLPLCLVGVAIFIAAAQRTLESISTR